MKTRLHSFALPLIALTAACSGDREPEPGPEPTTATEVTHVDALGASQLLSSDTSIVVLDVRTPEEFAEGHLPGDPVNVDFKAEDFAQQAAELDRATPYLVHCRSGRRSTEALETLKGLGFQKLYHLDGGIAAWQEAGEAVE